MQLIHKLGRLLFPPKKNVLFYRDFQGLTGGHLKVWHYFQHVASSKHYQPNIYFTPHSDWLDNPWSHVRAQCFTEWHPEQTDILFMEGMDWQALSITPKMPIINLIQHVRHTYPHNPRYAFLKQRAIRIGVSPEVTAALEQTSCVNGPIFNNSNGLDNSSLPAIPSEDSRDIDVLIIGLKEPTLAADLAQRICELYPQLHTVTLTQLMLRQDFLKALTRSKIAIFLPMFEDKEGFYLPALEAMALRTLVICPDCVGNRSFCLPNVNCFRPEYRLNELLHSLYCALQLSKVEFHDLLDNATKTAQEYTLERERKVFLNILENIEQIW